MAILAILMTLAWPTYQGAVQKGRRADAMAALAQLMQTQERWRSEHASYQSTLSDLPGARATSAEAHYSLTLVDGSVSANGYTAQATAQSTSPQIGDTTCRVMQVAIAGGNITYSSINASSKTNPTPDPCWVK